MFNGLIAKSVIRDNIHILIPNNKIDDNILILISHGSGGLGSAEYNAAEYFLSKGYRVGFLDYFSKYNISNLWWSGHATDRDCHTVSFNDMLTNITFPNDKIVHIGFSLGGFFGIINADKFYKNYCFYPGIIAFTDKMLNADYKNTTVFQAEFDNWCYYDPFGSYCKFPPTSIIIKNTFHGFMIPDKDYSVEIAIYNFPKKVISDEEFKSIMPNHDVLGKKYGYTNRTIRLKYDKESCIMCLAQIYKEIT